MIRGFLSKWPWSKPAIKDIKVDTTISFWELNRFFHWIDNQTEWELYDGKWRMSDGERMHTRSTMELYKQYRNSKSLW